MSTTIVLLTVILGALLYGCVGEDVALTKEGKEALKKVGFIHITKTGMYHEDSTYYAAIPYTKLLSMYVVRTIPTIETVPSLILSYIS